MKTNKPAENTWSTAKFDHLLLLLLLLFLSQHFQNCQAAIVWYFDDDLKLPVSMYIDEEHSCNPPPDTCCRPPGFGGGGGGSGGYGGPGGCPTCPNFSGGLMGGGDGTGATDGPGMARWWVSEPNINLWLEDTPMWYQPSRGSAVEVKLQFKNYSGWFNKRDFQQKDIFSFGNGWHSAWRSYLQVEGTTALLFRGDGSFSEVPVGGQKDYHKQSTLEGVPSGSPTNYIITLPSGHRQIYGFTYTNNSDVTFFLSRIEDPQGNALRLVHVLTNNSIRLTKLIDTDNLETTLSYTNAGTYSNLISKILGPVANIKSSFEYDEWGRLTNITDAVGMRSQFAYADSSTNSPAYDSGLTQLITPYGTTTFLTSGHSDTTPNADRSILVTEPGSRTHFFAYKGSLGNGEVTNSFAGLEPTLDTSLPSASFDTVSSNLRNSFYWSPKVIDQLSDGALTNLLAGNLPEFANGDYGYARQRHWLQRQYTSRYNNLLQYFTGSTLSLERQPTPDGTQAGLITWYDYEGKAAEDQEGTNYLPRVTGWKLANGQSQYSFTLYNTRGHQTTVADTYADTLGNVALRTNRFEYGTNETDMTRHLQVLGSASKQVVSNVYNASHQVVTSYNALNETTTFTYDGSNRLTSVTRPTGWQTTNIYGSSGNLASTIDWDSSTSVYFRTNSFTYTNGLIRTHTDPRGLTLTYDYDKLWRTTAIVHPDGSSNSFTFDRLDLVEAIDRMGFTKRMEYDSLRQKVLEVDALGRTNTFTYCTCGSLDSVSDAMGNTTSFFYDNLGRNIATHYSDGLKTTNHFDINGRLVAKTDSMGSAITNVYVNQGLLIGIHNQYGYLASKSFDIEDHLVYERNSAGIITTNAYDDLGRLTARGFSDGGLERFVHSAHGLVAYTNQLGQGTLYGYDAMRRKIVETNALEFETRFTNSPAGDLLALKDGKNQNTFWAYDQYGRTTNKLDHFGTNVFRYTYDANGRLTSRWTPEKGTTYFTNDAVGNLTAVNYPISSDLSLKYDALNRLTNMVDGVGTTTYSYSSVGQILSEDGPWSEDTVSYTYSNRLKSALALALPNGPFWSQSYAFDGLKRLTNITSPAGVFGYTYASQSWDLENVASPQVLRLNLPGGSVITNAYDSVGRLTETRLRNATGTLLNRHDYTYNSGNQRTRQTRTGGDYVDYAYDVTGQLLAATGKESGGSTSRAHEMMGYLFDAVGNLIYRTNNAYVQTFRVNKLNQPTNTIRSGSFTVAGHTLSAASSVTVNTLTATRYADNTFSKDGFSLSNGTNTFTAVATDAFGRGDTNVVSVFLPSTNSYLHDLNGNMRTNGTRVFEYDDENQLTRITEPSAWKSEFVYDGKLRMRISRDFTWRNGVWTQTNETRRVYDGMLPIQERDQLNVPRITYTRGKDLSGSLEGAGGIGGLLALTDHSTLNSSSSQPASYYFHSDGNGNVTALVDTNQNVVARYLYDPFGNTLSSAGPKAALNKYRFSSKEWHGSSGMVYYGYRWYIPELQRWPNRDPIGEWGGLNLHALRGQSPINLIDPWGLDIRFCPEASDKFKTMMNACICELRKSSRGRELLAMADETAGVTLCPGKGPATGTDRTGTTIAMITMYPLSKNGVPPGYGPDMKKCERAPNNVRGCAAVLGHELGHALTGAEDEGEAPFGRNVRENENVIRRELGLPERCSYHGNPLTDQEQ